MKLLKIIAIFCGVSFFTLFSLPSQEKLYLSYLPNNKWQKLKSNRNPQQEQSKKWAWTSDIILKSPLAINGTTFVLRWHGAKIPNLFASLFKKKPSDKMIIPIEQNLIGDGRWNAKKQEIMFTLNSKIVATNRYHLVLNFSPVLEKRLRSGHFSLVEIPKK